MNRITFAVLEVSAAAVVLLPVYLILNKVLFHDLKKSALYCIFSFYLAAVYTLVGLPNVTYIRLELNLNLIPVLGLVDDWKNSILNVLLFVPLGIMLPIVHKKYRVRKKTVLFGFGMSLAIEAMQILTFRATDVNDLITNVFGTFLGCSFVNFLMKKLPAVKRLVKEERNGELYIVCALTFFVMFFVQPFISSAMWDLILY